MRLKKSNFLKVENLGFFWKNRWVFWKKLEFFQNQWRWQIWCRMRIKWYYFLKMSFPPSLWGFLAKKKNRKLRMLETLENMMKKKCFFFEEKVFSSFKIASLLNWEGAKYAGGSWPFCLGINSINFLPLPLHCLEYFGKGTLLDESIVKHTRNTCFKDIVVKKGGRILLEVFPAKIFKESLAELSTKKKPVYVMCLKIWDIKVWKIQDVAEPAKNSN